MVRLFDLSKFHLHFLTSPVDNTRARKRVYILKDDDENEQIQSDRDNHEEDGREDNESMLLDLPLSSVSKRLPSTYPPGAREQCKRVPSPQTAIDELHELNDALLQTPTPSTPSRRDALSKRAPLTPRHRIIVGARPLTPRTPRTPSASTSVPQTVYSDARKLFTRGADPGSLVGRTKERAELLGFVSSRTRSQTGGCLYVSGPPGTGKSALVTEVCRGLGGEENVKYAYINCMSIKNPIDVYTLAAAELDAPHDAIGSGEQALQSLFLRRKSNFTYLVVLDEIDSLLSLDLGVLYNLFEWAFVPHSKLVLVGIANALDLTDRFLPRLKARNLKPELLPFLPYSAAEIASVLTSRCRSLLPLGHGAAPDFVPVLHPSAIQLISKKVAAQTGDLRKSFDIAQRAVDLIEVEAKEKITKDAGERSSESTPTKSPLGENPNLSSPKNPSPPAAKQAKPSLARTQYTAQTAPRATLAHVVRVTSAAFGNGILQRLKSLNLQQKAVLCALVALESRNRQAGTLSPPQTPDKAPKKTSAAPTIRALGHAYAVLCKRDNILHALSSGEFRDILSTLETSSLVAAVDGKSGSLAAPATPSKRGRGAFGGASADERRFSACVGVKDLEVAAEGVGGQILRGILYGDVFG